MSDPGSNTPQLAFPRILGQALESFGELRVLGADGFYELAQASAPGCSFVGYRDFAVMVDDVAASDVACLLLPPWGTRNGVSLPWAALRVPAGGLALLVPAGDLQHHLPRHTAHLGVPSVVLVGRVSTGHGGASLEAAVVMFDSGDSGAITRFFTVPEGESTDVLAGDFRKLLQQGGGRTTFGYVHRGPSLAGKSFRPADHDPALAARRAELSEFGANAALSEIFEVLRPRTKREPEAVAGRLVGARDIGRVGRLTAETEGNDPKQSHSRGVVALNAGDFLLRSIERPDAPWPPAVVRESDIPAAAGSSLLVLRPRVAFSDEELEFYRFYLASRRFREGWPSRLAGSVNLARLEQARLPVPDEDLLDALMELRTARESFAGWADEGYALGIEAFEGSARDSRRRLVDMGRTLRQRVEAASAVGTLDHRIANFYPYPIAAQYRQVRVSQSSGDDRATYTAILDCCETTLAVCASLALAFARAHGIPVAAMQEVRRKLSGGSGAGVGLGDWAVILKEVSSGKAFARINADAPLATIRQALPEGSPAARAQERLKTRRNAESHLRRLDDIELSQQLGEAMGDLELLLNHLDFLSDLHLLQIDSTRWDALEGSGMSRARSLRGDQPIGMVESVMHAQPDLEKGSLYVRDQTRVLTLIRPFLVRLQCPTCRTWSTFCPDHRSEGQLRLKALDHSHSVEARDHLTALKSVGYIN